MNRNSLKPDNSSHWHLYWVESDGSEDCFVVARNSRSACSVEIHMNGFETDYVRATRVQTVTLAAERIHRKKNPDTKWPGYVYGREFFEKMGAQFRSIEDRLEMLIEDVVYAVDEFAPCSITRQRSIGRRAIAEMESDQNLGEIELFEEDLWNGPVIHLVTALGMSLTNCQLIEYYISRSFLLGISKKQKKKYHTLNDLKNGWKKKTLGNMLNCIEEAWEIEENVKASLYVFIQNRNLLIHNITTEERFNIRTHWGQEEFIAFLKFFDIHARAVKLLFRSSYYASVDFAINTWGRPSSLTQRMYGRKHRKEASLFFHFFTPKEDAI